MENICEHCGYAYVPNDDDWFGDTHCSIECLAQANVEADEQEPPR